VNILAIETATIEVGVAVADENGPVAAFSVRARRRHAESLHPAVETVLSAAGVGLADVNAIAVDIGPGLFTGIRVGVAAAKGYAMALGIPIVALTSLEILRAACAAAGVGDSAGLDRRATVIGVVDLRRGEVAWSFPPGPGGGGQPAHGAPAELAAKLAGYLGDAAGPEQVVLAGDGAIRYRAVLADGQDVHAGRVTIAGPELAAPPVASLAVQVVIQWAGGRALDPAEVRPAYLRDADTRINWSTRHDAPGLVRD
jgi:tRNA threonylcarbamoyladenosine biosynthesis protein TsaB